MAKQEKNQEDFEKAIHDFMERLRHEFGVDLVEIALHQTNENPYLSDTVRYVSGKYKKAFRIKKT